jgi:hypothetical protein
MPGSLRGITQVERNVCLTEMKILQQGLINSKGIKSRVPQESFRSDKRMFPEEIVKDRKKGFSITQGFILIR